MAEKDCNIEETSGAGPPPTTPPPESVPPEQESEWQPEPFLGTIDPATLDATAAPGANAIVVAPADIKEALYKRLIESGQSIRPAEVNIYKRFSCDPNVPEHTGGAAIGSDQSPIEMPVKDGTYVQIKEWGLGFNGHWCRIEIVDSAYQPFINTRLPLIEKGTEPPLYMLAAHLAVWRSATHPSLPPPPQSISGCDELPDTTEAVVPSPGNLVDLANWGYSRSRHPAGEAANIKWRSRRRIFSAS